MRIVKENKVKHDRRGVLICGKGTAMMTKGKMETCMTRKLFNEDKTIAHTIRTGKRREDNITIAAHQAPNHNNKYKWRETKMLMEGLAVEY